LKVAVVPTPSALLAAPPPASTDDEYKEAPAHASVADGVLEGVADGDDDGAVGTATTPLVAAPENTTFRLRVAML
jgi:hypothetical protein